MTMPDYIPGTRLAQAVASGKIDPGKVLFQLAPALPHEGPPLPRFLLTSVGNQAVQTQPQTYEQIVQNNGGQSVNFPTTTTPAAPVPAPVPQPVALQTPTTRSTQVHTMDEFTGPNHKPVTYRTQIKQIV